MINILQNKFTQLLFAFLLFSFPIHGQENMKSLHLWGGALSEMSPDQVISTVPNAFAVKDPNDKTRLIKIRNFKWENIIFDANFHFFNCKLNSITLSDYDSHWSKAFDQSVKDAKILVKQIRYIYGKEKKNQLSETPLINPNESDKQFIVEWENQNGLKISLSVSSLLNAPAHTTLTFYTPFNIKEKDKNNTNNRNCVQLPKKYLDSNIISNDEEPGPPEMKLLPPASPPNTTE